MKKQKLNLKVEEVRIDQAFLSRVMPGGGACGGGGDVDCNCDPNDVPCIAGCTSLTADIGAPGTQDGTMDHLGFMIDGVTCNQCHKNPSYSGPCPCPCM